MTEEAAEDERDIELSSITAIFPELCIDPSDSHAATLDLQIAPSIPITLTFQPAPDQFATAQQGPTYLQLAPTFPDSHALSYLPPLKLQINLPDHYPDDEPPQLRLTTTPDWLPPSLLTRLNAEGINLWEEYGRSQVVYAYIDFLQQEAERGFGLADGKGWELPHALKASLLDHDRQTKEQIFHRGTFECGVCLEPKKGSACYRLRRCGHVFCVGCLQDFYNSAIAEGDISSVKCLSPSCGMERLNAEQRRKKKQRTLHPTELLDIPLAEAQVRRYVNLKLKKKLETDKSTVYCPRTWCQGPAKSVKYAKYDTRNLEQYPESESEQEDGGEPLAMPNTNMATNTNRTPPPDRLCVCSICEFAFCRLCQRSWHGDHINCLPRSTADFTEEEKASYDYIRLHTSPCPTCASPCQKTHGCNHMRCFQCATHFCYLCSSWLNPGDPYKHFNEQGRECYMRLWELEEGDEGPENRRGEGHFVGARAAEAAAAAHLAEAEAMQMEEFAAAEAEGAAQDALFNVPALLDQIDHEWRALRAQIRPGTRIRVDEIDQVERIVAEAHVRIRQILLERRPEPLPLDDELLRDVAERLNGILRRVRDLHAQAHAI